MTPCKICQSDTYVHGVCDLNKSCEANRGRFFALAGEPVWYHRCTTCGFLFTTYFDRWTPARWREDIYNDDYAEFDPDGADGSRARANAPLVCDLAHRLGVSSLLDYGGGDGTLGRLLVTRGFDAWSWDEYSGGHPPPYHVPLVTAFEVLEHTTTPIETAKKILSWLTPGGTFLFSTLTMDSLLALSMDHWYIAPRNGHVSLHTSASLYRLFTQLGWQVRHLNEAVHIATALPNLSA